jgi:hypothetical protein
MLRAVVLSDDHSIYKRVALKNRYISKRLSKLLLRRPDCADFPNLESRTDFAVRSLFATLHERFLFDRIEPGRFAVTDTDLKRFCTDAFLASLAGA